MRTLNLSSGDDRRVPRGHRGLYADKDSTAQITMQFSIRCSIGCGVRTSGERLFP